MFSRYRYTEGLVRVIDSNGQFFINYLGQVKDQLGNNIDVTKDDENHLIVNITSWDGERPYRIVDLMVIHFKDLRIPKSLYNTIQGFTIDDNKENVQAKNIGYRFINGKLEVPAFPGFYYVPGFTVSAININGDIINSNNGKILKGYIGNCKSTKNAKGGYCAFGSVGANGKATSLFRHRAMALVFLDYPNYCDRLVVNHRDGIPGNDWLDNLEWMTKGQNNIHAYENDLKNQNKHVLVRNVLTGEVTEYYSISECARQLGYPTDETIRQRLITNEFSNAKIHQDGMQVKFKDDTRDWYVPIDPIKAIEEAQIKVSVKARSCLDFTVKIYATLTDAYKDTGVSSSTIKLRLDRRDYTPIRGYQFMLANDNRPWYNFTQEEYLETLDPFKNEVIARNHITQQEIKFDSINKATKFFNKQSISHHLNNGIQPLYSDGWQIKYSKEEWINFDDIEKELYLRTIEVMAKHESTGKVLMADSCRKMAEVLKLDPKSIRKAAITRGNILYHGYRFRLGHTSESWPE